MNITIDSLTLDISNQQKSLYNIKREVGKEYKNAILSIFYNPLIKRGGVLLLDPEEPVIFSVGESISYTGDNHVDVLQPQFLAYYLTNRSNVDKALSSATYDLGLNYLLGALDNKFSTFSVTGASVTSTDVLTEMAATLFFATLPWWAYAAIGYAAAFAAL